MDKSQNSMSYSQEGGSNLSERVMLNVGGKKFETTIATLTRIPDTLIAYFHAVSNRAHPERDDYYPFTMALRRFSWLFAT
uniref:BTB_2 domain-containing protein n=1 Tax=Caenorhabditis japonica TaxID=281687 RepID=A0A8R1DT30_CAEJA